MEPFHQDNEFKLVRKSSQSRKHIVRPNSDLINITLRLQKTRKASQLYRYPVSPNMHYVYFIEILIQDKKKAMKERH